MPSVFTKIINRDLPAHIVAENENYIAFLDIHPVCIGHTLVVPKKEIDYIFDLDDETLTGLHSFSKHVAIALKKAIPCKRIAVSVIGLEVPHAHVHLLPINSMNDTNFNKPKLSLTQEQLHDVAEKIKSSF